MHNYRQLSSGSPQCSDFRAEPRTTFISVAGTAQGGGKYEKQNRQSNLRYVRILDRQARAGVRQERWAKGGYF